MTEPGTGGATLPDHGAAGLGHRRLHVVLVLDCSGSMTGEKIASLNFAIRSAIPALRQAAEDNPETEVLLRAIRVSTRAEWHVETPVPADGFEWADLAAGGETATGEALALLAAALEREAGAGRQLAPILVLVSDGYPTDDFEAGLARLMAAEAGAKAARIAIAIGNDTDGESLTRFIGQPGLRPLVAHNAEMLVNRIRWATTEPLRAASRPAAPSGAAEARAVLAGHAGAGPAAGDGGPASAESDLVW